MANPSMMRAFVETEGRKGVRVERARREPKKRKPIKTQSQKQEVREAFLSGVKASLLESGVRDCSRCPRSFESFDDAWAGLSLHHSNEWKRGQGTGFRGGKQFGVDDPRNLEIVCRACHRQLESNPMFGATA